MSCIKAKLSPKKPFPKYVKSELEEYFQCRLIENFLLNSTLLVYLQVPHCVVPDPLADPIMLLKQLGK